MEAGNVRSYTYGEFLRLLPFCSEETKAELIEKLTKAEKPKVMCGIKVPDNLNEVSYGMLDDLANISSNGGDDPMAEAICLILNLGKERLYEANVFDVFGISNWIGDEVTKINKLFASISPKHSAEEIAAGVKQLNFGSFGVLDWYAHRQGIADQNDVRDVAWVRIFTCMKNDNIKAEYERRLNSEYSKKYKNGRSK